MVGKEVAKLVTNLEVVNYVLLSSFDPFKILAAKNENPALVVGTFYKTRMWDDSKANDMKSEFENLPGMQACVQKAPNGTEFINFLFRNGALLKSTNGSFVVMNYNIYNNEKYAGNNTFQTFKDNYSPDLSFGAFIIDNLKLTDEQRKNDEKYLDLLINNTASCLVTDNVPRLLKKLGRSPTPEKPTQKGFANKNLPAPLVLSAIFLFVWLFR